MDHCPCRKLLAHLWGKQCRKRWPVIFFGDQTWSETIRSVEMRIQSSPWECSKIARQTDLVNEIATIPPSQKMQNLVKAYWNSGKFGNMILHPFLVTMRSGFPTKRSGGTGMKIRSGESWIPGCAELMDPKTLRHRKPNFWVPAGDRCFITFSPWKIYRRCPIIHGILSPIFPGLLDFMGKSHLEKDDDLGVAVL